MTSSDHIKLTFASSRRAQVMILSSFDRADVKAEIEKLKPTITQFADIVLIDLNNAEDLSSLDVDLAIVIGGDGSVLRAAHQMGYQQIPVLAINMGKLGFLSDILPEKLPTVLEAVLDGKCRLVNHLMFDSQVIRNDQVIHEKLGLNEVAILAGPPFTILEVELYVNDILGTIYSCDGLIISSPVGSTAHSLSAGGPIVRKDLQAFVICPISPHTLTNRPVIDTAERIYDMVVPNPHEGTSVVIDGQIVCTLQAQDRIRIQRADASFQLVEVEGHGYYHTLREKLGWSGGLIQRGTNQRRS